MVRPTLLGIAIVLIACCSNVRAADPGRYRGMWVETFNTPLGTHADVDRVVASAAEGAFNILYVQVRRRGDSWYLDSREPLTEVPGVGEPDRSGVPTFDPLRYLIAEAHARGIEVHAFTIVGSVYRDDPAQTLPRNPSHVFVQHIWNAATGAPYDDDRQWATRAIGPNLTGTSYGGQRFATDWYVDLGHPDAEAYTVDVLMHLVKQYDIDGLHLDRIRYPESPSDGGLTSNVGYNAVSVQRFNTLKGRSGNPKSSDPLWSQWRRDQVTNFVRRLYLNIKAVKPKVRLSGALICFSSGPAASGGFSNTEAYWRVFQDWKGWAEEGIIDMLVPMDYKRESVAAQVVQFDDWAAFTIDTARATGSISVIGLGAYLNPIDATARQVSRAIARGADGVNFYSLASTNSDGRPVTEFLRAVRSPLVPVVSSAPARGLLMGIARDEQGLVLDGAQVMITNLVTAATRVTTTDGGGFYGAAGLETGSYRVSVAGRLSCVVVVSAGRVAIANIPAPDCNLRRRSAERGPD